MTLRFSLGQFLWKASKVVVVWNITYPTDVVIVTKGCLLDELSFFNAF